MTEDPSLGVPAELLRRRPDIRKAERELAAATEYTSVAIASLFPRLSLRGFVGDISPHLHSLCGPSSATWIAGPQLLLPIFNSKLLQQDVSLNKIKTRRALYTYQKTVLEALEEAENAIAAFHSEQQRQQQLQLAQKLAEEAYELTYQLHQRGFKSYLEVLESYRHFLEAQEGVMQSQLQLTMHYIYIYKALGGGWCSSQTCE
jgi:outer membrane protein TolC